MTTLHEAPKSYWAIGPFIFIVTLVLSICCFAESPVSEKSGSLPLQEVVTLDVEGMTCAMCPITIRKSLSKVEGVINANVNFETKTATVTYDPRKVKLHQLTRATTNAGYPSVVKAPK